MPRQRTKRPAYRHYSPKNLAVVCIDGRDHFLGPYGSDESSERYHRLVAESLAGSPTTAAPITPASTSSLTISELISRYWEFAQVYYR